MIEAEETGFRKIVNYDPKSNPEVINNTGAVETAGVSYKKIKICKDKIVIYQDIYADVVGNSIGCVKLEIKYDSNTSKLVLGKTSYISK